MDEMCFEICSEVFYFGAQFDIPPYIAMFAVNLIYVLVILLYCPGSYQIYE